MQYEIKHIHENLGVTVVYVTHDQSEALTMSNRVAVFEDGVIQQLAPPDELYERPDNAFVAQFIGENNTLVGTIKEISGDIVSVDVNGSMIKAKNIAKGKVGDKTTLSIRPERVATNPSNEGDYQNNFKAKIEELIYLGDHIRTRASVCGDDEFVVKIANTSALAAIKVGTDVTFGWKAEDCRALDV